MVFVYISTSCFRRKCVTVQFRECKETAKDLECETVGLRVPYQEKIHRVKCLLTSNGAEPPLDVDESARSIPILSDLDQNDPQPDNDNNDDL